MNTSDGHTRRNRSIAFFSVGLSKTTKMSRSSRQWYVAPISAQARRASFVRTALISHRSCVADPQSPGVAVATWTAQPA